MVIKRASPHPDRYHTYFIMVARSEPWEFPSRTNLIVQLEGILYYEYNISLSSFKQYIYILKHRYNTFENNNQQRYQLIQQHLYRHHWRLGIQESYYYVLFQQNHHYHSVGLRVS